MTGLSAAGVPMNDDSTLSVITVFTCIAILSDAVSTLPLIAYKKTKDRSKKVVSPAPPLIANPWPEGTLQSWLTQVMVSLLLRGNFYGQIVDRDSFGRACMIMPIHPDKVMAKRNWKTGEREYRLDGKLIPTVDILHIPALLTPGSFVGLNPIEYMRGAFGLAAATERFGGQYFANSANPSGVIEVESDLTETETLEMARAWKAAHQGLGQANLPAVLTGGATWKTIGISPDDAQFLATRAFQAQTIASFFRVPEHLMGTQDRTSSWGSGIEQMELQFVQHTLNGWLQRIEGPLSDLLPPSQDCRFDLMGRLRGDTLQRFQSYTLARNGSWMNVDEIREREDMPALPNGLGSDYWAPMNFAPVDQILDGTAGGGGSGGQGGGVAQHPDAPPSPPPPSSKPDSGSKKPSSGKTSPTVAQS